MTSDEEAQQSTAAEDSTDVSPVDQAVSQSPTWANDAISLDVLLDEDHPHASVMELLVGDLEGRLGAVYVDLGPMEVQLLLRQLEDVQLAQQIAEWEAAGNDIGDFPLDGPAGAVDYSDDDYDEDDEPSIGRVERLTDPLAVKTWMSQDYRLFGIPVQYLLVGLAVVVGVIMATVGTIL